MTTIAQAADLFCDEDANGLDWAPTTHAKRAGHMANYVLPRYGDLPLEELDAVTINDIVAAYDGSAKKQLYNSVRAFVRWADQRGLPVDVDACFSSRLRKPAGARAKVAPGDIPELEHVHALAANIDQDVARLAVATLALTGVRVSELLALTPSRFDFEVGRILVDRQHDQHGLRPTKTGGHRYTVLPPSLEDALAARAERAAPGGPVFAFHPDPSRFGTYTKLRYRFEKGAAATPTWADGWTLHSLRHHFATYAINHLRLPVVDVSRMLGHSSPSTTMDLYVGQSADAFTNARAAMAAQTESTS